MAERKHLGPPDSERERLVQDAAGRPTDAGADTATQQFLLERVNRLEQELPPGGELLPDDFDLEERVEKTRQTAKRGFENGFSDGVYGLERVQSQPAPKTRYSYAYREGYEAGHAAGREMLRLDELTAALRSRAVQGRSVEDLTADDLETLPVTAPAGR